VNNYKQDWDEHKLGHYNFKPNTKNSENNHSYPNKQVKQNNKHLKSYTYLQQYNHLYIHTLINHNLITSKEDTNNK
jgi:hypothetical protein